MAEPTIDDLLKSYSAEVQALARETHALVRTLLPDATEKVHLGWKSISIGTGPAMADQLFAILPQRSRVNLGLWGAGLPDPTGLLEGTGARGRHVKITSAERLADPALRELVRAAIAAAAAPKTAVGAAEAPKPPVGYKFDRIRTLEAPIAEVFAAWNEPKLRRRWLDETGLVVRRATPEKSLRITWPDGTWVTVTLTAKGDGRGNGRAARTAVAVEHSRIPDTATVERMKSYWEDHLGRLRDFLAG